MANMKWIVLMLLVIFINLGFLTIFLTATLKENQEGCVVTANRIVKNPFASSVKKYFELKGMASTDKVAIELSAQDQKINIMLSIARIYGIPHSFANEVGKEPSTSQMSIAHKNTIQPSNGFLNQEFKPSLQTTLPELEDLRARIKRENTSPSVTKVDIKSSTTSPQTAIMQGSTNEIIIEQTIPQTTPVEEPSASNDRSIREALTPIPESEVTTSETYTTPSPTTLSSESTLSSKISRRAPSESDLRENQKSSFYRVHRALLKPDTQTTVEQEVTTLSNRVARELSEDSAAGTKQETTTPAIRLVIRDAITSITKNGLTDEITTSMDGDNTELSTLDLNSSTTVPPRMVRDALKSLNQDVTKPSSRIFKETLTRSRRNEKEENSPTNLNIPFSKGKTIVEDFVKKTFIPVVEGLKQIKLQGKKEFSVYDEDYPTFPPMTDPEGTDF